MKLAYYLEEKINFILFQISFVLLVSLFLIIFNVDIFYILLFIFGSSLYTFLYLLLEFIRMEKEYNKIIYLVDNLKEKYYISEVIKEPKQLVNKGMYYALKCSCKAMNDKISFLEKNSEDFEEYVESFVHDIKTPITALSLYFDNTKNLEKKQEIEQIETKIEQMLFFARSDTLEKDYFIRKIELDELIHPILLKYKNYFLNNNIKMKVSNLEFSIYSDEKWIVFILSQIIENSIKYLDKNDKKIEIYAKSFDQDIALHIKDNGCGISKSDLPRIFEKGFTGTNRKKSSSTGMGLYLVKKLCNKLDLTISVDSKEKEYTLVIIKFSKNRRIC